jgi:hypothetical protein
MRLTPRRSGTRPQAGLGRAVQALQSANHYGGHACDPEVPGSRRTNASRLVEDHEFGDDRGLEIFVASHTRDSTAVQIGLG